MSPAPVASKDRPLQCGSLALQPPEEAGIEAQARASRTELMPPPPGVGVTGQLGRFCLEASGRRPEAPLGLCDPGQRKVPL